MVHVERIGFGFATCISLLLTLAISLGCATAVAPVSDTQPLSAKHSAKRQKLEAILSELDLSGQQRSQIAAIHENRDRMFATVTRRRDLRAKLHASIQAHDDAATAAIHAELEQLRQLRVGQPVESRTVRSVLSDAQRSKFDLARDAMIESLRAQNH